MPFSKRRSLAVKIPLLTALLLVAALAAMSVASYIELRTALVEMATGRLHQAGDQIAAVFSMSARQRINAMKELMARPEIHQFLRTRDASQRLRSDVPTLAQPGPQTGREHNRPRHASCLFWSQFCRHQGCTLAISMHWSNRANPFLFADLDPDPGVAARSQVLQINNRSGTAAHPHLGQCAPPAR